MFSALQDLVAEAKEKMQCYQAVLGLVAPDSPIGSFVVEIVDRDPQQK